LRAPLRRHARGAVAPRRASAAKRRRRPRAPALLLDLRRPAQRLLLTQRALRREQLLLRAPRPPPLLAADARPLGRGGLRVAARARRRAARLGDADHACQLRERDADRDRAAGGRGHSRLTSVGALELRRVRSRGLAAGSTG